MQVLQVIRHVDERYAGPETQLERLVHHLDARPLDGAVRLRHLEWPQNLASGLEEPDGD